MLYNISAFCTMDLKLVLSPPVACYEEYTSIYAIWNFKRVGSVYLYSTFYRCNSVYLNLCSVVQTPKIVLGIVTVMLLRTDAAVIFMLIFHHTDFDPSSESLAGNQRISGKNWDLANYNNIVSNIMERILLMTASWKSAEDLCVGQMKSLNDSTKLILRK